jgi:hypothetical protein
MKESLKWIVLGVAVIILIIAVVMRFTADQRYNGWARYQDKTDNYELMAPPQWEIIEETSIAGFRGARVFQSEQYQSDLGTLTVFAVYTRDMEGASPGEEELRRLADRIARADLKQYTLEPVETAEGRLAEFTLNGTAYIESIPVTGRIWFTSDEATLLAAVSILPDQRREELKQTFELIHESVKFSESE